MSYKSKNEGGKRCSLRRPFLRLSWWAQGYNERRTKKNPALLVPRRAVFFVGGLAPSAVAFGRPATLAPLRSAGAAPTERQRLQDQPLSGLLARSPLPCAPPKPPKGCR